MVALRVFAASHDAIEAVARFTAAEHFCLASAPRVQAQSVNNASVPPTASLLKCRASASDSCPDWQRD
jgi:hypothetical protein